MWGHFSWFSELQRGFLGELGFRVKIRFWLGLGYSLRLGVMVRITVREYIVSVTVLISIVKDDCVASVCVQVRTGVGSAFGQGQV